MRERIQQIMKMKSVNAAEFADLMQIKRPGLSHILTGRNNPSLDFVMKLKETFPEINLEWLLFGRGPVTQLSNAKAQPTDKAVVQADLFQAVEESKNETDQAVNMTTKAADSNLFDQQSYISGKHVDYQTQKSQTEAAIQVSKNENPALERQDFYRNIPAKKAVKTILIYEDGTFDAFDRSV